MNSLSAPSSILFPLKKCPSQTLWSYQCGSGPIRWNFDERQNSFPFTHALCVTVTLPVIQLRSLHYSTLCCFHSWFVITAPQTSVQHRCPSCCLQSLMFNFFFFLIQNMFLCLSTANLWKGRKHSSTASSLMFFKELLFGPIIYIDLYSSLVQFFARELRK